MGKIAKYQKIIIKLLEDYATVKPANLEEHEYQVIADTKRNHYELVSMGRHKNAFFHNVVFHLDIRDNDKVWLQVNNTDWDITEALIENGISKQEIVLGTLSPNMRKYSGFAIA